MSKLPRKGVQLGLHQVRRKVDDMHLQPAIQQTTRGLQAKQTTSDHHGPARVGGVLYHLHAIVEGAEDEQARPEGAVFVVQPVHRRHKWHAPRGNHQFVVGHKIPTGCVDGLGLPVYANGADARVQSDVVLLVPLQRIDEDVLLAVSAGEDSGQEDAVVVAVRLIAEDRDIELVAAALGQRLLDQPRSGHPTTTSFCFVIHLPSQLFRLSRS